MNFMGMENNYNIKFNHISHILFTFHSSHFIHSIINFIFLWSVFFRVFFTAKNWKKKLWKKYDECDVWSGERNKIYIQNLIEAEKLLKKKIRE
jgi:large-conductance mechanosensitive channel